MPVVRDISPSKQRMILEWLDNPIRIYITEMSLSSPDFGVNIYEYSPEVVPFPICITASVEYNYYVPCYCEGVLIPVITLIH